MMIERVLPADFAGVSRQLSDLLINVVDSGAAVSFIAPLARSDCESYWASVEANIRAGGCVLLVALVDDSIVGTAQLHLVSWPNGVHRADVAKVLVHTDARRQGIGRALMQALEAEARAAGRSTLVLDTREGDPSENLYRSLGWQRAGSIPNYARSSDGSMHATVFYFKLLS